MRSSNGLYVTASNIAKLLTNKKQCQAAIKAIAENHSTLPIPKRTDFYLHSELQKILASNLRLSFLARLQRSVRQYIITIEGKFEETTHQQIFTLKCDDSSMIHTYLRQQFESLGIKFLTETLEVWINSLSRTGILLNEKQLPRSLRGKSKILLHKYLFTYVESAGLVATLLMYHLSNKHKRAFLYYKACARVIGGRSIKVINDIFAVVENIHSAKQANLESIDLAAIQQISYT